MIVISWPESFQNHFKQENTLLVTTMEGIFTSGHFQSQFYKNKSFHFERKRAPDVKFGVVNATLE